jgi:hypothetical protein
MTSRSTAKPQLRTQSKLSAISSVVIDSVAGRRKPNNQPSVELPIEPSLGANDEPTQIDTKRTLERYEAATRKLKDSLANREKEWILLEPEEFSDNKDFSKFRRQLGKILNARQQTNATIKSRTVFEKIFVFFTPFMQHFLAISQGVQSVLTLSISI